MRRGMSLIHDAIANEPLVLREPAPAVDVVQSQPHELGIGIRVWCDSAEAASLPALLKEQLQASFRAHKMRISFR